MGFFDSLKKIFNGGGTNVVTGSNKSFDITFPNMPADLESFKALPQASLVSPYDTAALTVVALSFYPKDRELCYAALDILRGPRPLSGVDKQFINDRFMDGKEYLMRSYFNGATPQNDYAPSEPYTVTVSENPYSRDNAGYLKLFIRSGGADSARYVTLRNAKDGKWYLWEQFLLSDIRAPESTNPWA